MRKVYLFGAMAVFCGMALGAILENTNIQVEINGDGKVGALAYKVDIQNNNVNDASMRLKSSGATVETQRVPGSEKVYPKSQLFVGYGSGIFSNLFIFTVANIPEENNAVNQVNIITSRESTNLGVAHYVDADVYGTIENDYAEPYNSANYVVTTQETKDRYVGFTGRCASLPPSSFMIDDMEKVAIQVQTSVLPDTIQTNESPNLAAALAYPQQNVDREAVRVTSKLMIGSNNTEIQQLTNTDNAPVYFKGYGTLTDQKVSFSQKFKKSLTDTLKIAFCVDMTDHASVMANLSDFDIAFYVGHDLFFLPGDGTETKVKKNQRLHKVVDPKGGVKKLDIKTKSDGRMKVTFSVTKASIGGATGLNSQSATGKAREMFLPFTYAMIGTSATDTAKKGKVWIASGSFPMSVDVKQGKKAKGKLK